jgi:hypothetical protein
MTHILAIDPGPRESAYVCIDPVDCDIIFKGKVLNERMRGELRCCVEGTSPYVVAIEMIASYGLSVGAEVLKPASI